MYLSSGQESADEDVEATPRIVTRSQFPSVEDSDTPRGPLSNPDFTSADPTIRLRAIMAVDKSNTSMASRKPAPPTPSSDVASDFDYPNTTAKSQGIVALDAIFSHALSHAADTPQKLRDRTRRNSIDASEVEDSPRVLGVMRERARIRSGRKSMSDEEAENVISA